MTTRVVPVTLGMVDALLTGPEEFTRRFALQVAPGYLDVPEILPAVRDALAGGTPPDWFSHLIVDGETGTVVGFGGYKAPPVEGEVEIGYSVAPAHRRRGHATAAVRLFVDGARARGVTLVSAHTLPEASPSTRLLTRVGFLMTGAVPEAELGEVWRWELATPA